MGKKKSKMEHKYISSYETSELCDRDIYIYFESKVTF